MLSYTPSLHTHTHTLTHTHTDFSAPINYLKEETNKRCRGGVWAIVLVSESLY